MSCALFVFSYESGLTAAPLGTRALVEEFEPIRIGSSDVKVVQAALSAGESYIAYRLSRLGLPNLPKVERLQKIIEESERRIKEMTSQLASPDNAERSRVLEIALEVEAERREYANALADLEGAKASLTTEAREARLKAIFDDVKNFRVISFEDLVDELDSQNYDYDYDSVRGEHIKRIKHARETSDFADEIIAKEVKALRNADTFPAEERNQLIARAEARFEQASKNLDQALESRSLSRSKLAIYVDSTDFADKLTSDLKNMSKPVVVEEVQEALKREKANLDNATKELMTHLREKSLARRFFSRFIPGIGTVLLMMDAGSRVVIYVFLNRDPGLVPLRTIVNSMMQADSADLK